MKRFVLLAGLVFAVIAPNALRGPEARASAGARDEIVAAERAWAKAAVDGDVATFAGYMADDFRELVVTPATAAKKSGWEATTKAAWVANVRSKREKYDSVTLRNLNVYLHGDIATVTGEYSQKGMSGGKDISSSGLYTDTWVRRGSSWQLISAVFP